MRPYPANNYWPANFYWPLDRSAIPPREEY